MTPYLQKLLTKHSDVLDWIDDNADLLDTSMSDFLVKSYRELSELGTTTTVAFLLDPDGLNLPIEDIVGAVVRDEKYFTWDGLDRYNKNYADWDGVNNEDVPDIVLGWLFDGDCRVDTAVQEMQHKNLQHVVSSMTDFDTHLDNIVKPKPLIYNKVYAQYGNFKLSDYVGSDMYIAVDVRNIEVPNAWRPYPIHQPFDVYSNSIIRVATSKNTLYFKAASKSKWSENAFIMVSTNHLAKAHLDKIPVSTILPKHIVDKYGLPVVQY